MVKNRRYPIRMTLKDLEYKLEAYFLRGHRAYILNINLIDTINLLESSIKGIDIDGSIPLGANYKANLIRWFK